MPSDITLDLSPRRTASVPVELTSFAAVFTRPKFEVKLQWQTATESNNFGFDIERQAPSEEDDWQKIGFVPGHGTVTTAKQYQFTDNIKTLLAGGQMKAFYRLKQLDTDGQFEYSSIVEVGLSALTSGFALYPNYPNPFNPETRITYDIAAPSQVTLEIFNTDGQRVTALVNTVQETNQYIVSWQPKAQELASGIYMYRLFVQPLDGQPGFSKVRQMLLLK